MTNAFKLYSYGDKYRIIDEEEFIEIATEKMSHDNILKKQFANKKILKLTALKIYKTLKIKVIPVNVLSINIKGEEEPVLKTIEMIEEDIEKFIFEQIKENKENTDKFKPYLKGSKEAALKILEEDLKYESTEEEKTIESFLETEVYSKTEFTYKDNKISIALTDDRFICDENTQRIYKYKAVILDTDEYEFNFKKNELFTSRAEAVIESKKLVDEHYQLPIRNSKVQRIIVRTDEHKHLIVFWPDIDTDDDYIMANDIIGTSDLAGDTKTSLLFFNECKDASPAQVKIARDVIENCMNLQTMNVKHL